MRLLNAARDFEDDVKGTRARCPTLYVENHDHAQLASNAEGRGNWFRSQPWLIALYSTFGAVLCHNGQEQADDYYMTESGDGRVVPRPVMWNRSDDPEAQTARALQARLAALRDQHPAMRSRNFYPDTWDGQWRRRVQGYGVDCDRGLAVYHRWAATGNSLERIIVGLNFSDYGQTIDVQFSAAGTWNELLESKPCAVGNSPDGCWLRGHQVPRFWGRIFCLTTP